MILEQLEKIKPLCTFLDSNITMNDIKKKEQHLGIELPNALKDFYLSFHEDDPIYAGTSKFIPLKRLEAVEKEDLHGEFQFISVLKCQNGQQIGFYLDKIFQEEPKLARYNPNDLSAVHWMNSDHFSSWLLWEIGAYCLELCPNVVKINNQLFQGEVTNVLLEKFEPVLCDEPKFCRLYGFMGFTKKYKLWTMMSIWGNFYSHSKCRLGRRIYAGTWN